MWQLKQKLKINNHKNSFDIVSAMKEMPAYSIHIFTPCCLMIPNQRHTVDEEILHQIWRIHHYLQGVKNISSGDRRMSSINSTNLDKTHILV